MKLGRCPTCHGHLDLVAMMEDDAERELLALISKLPPKITRALLPYLTLFRAPTRDLALSRTLTLAQEALALTRDQDTLAAAMLETVESIRNKGSSKPLKNHNYLKQVLGALQEKYGTAYGGLSDRKSPEFEEIKRDNDAAYRANMRNLGFDIDESGKLVRREDA